MEYFIGRLHPLLVHLPIGFVLIGFVLDTLVVFGKRWERLRPAVTPVYFLGLLATLVTVTSGIQLAEHQAYIPDLLDRHKNLGIIFMLATALICALRVLPGMVSEKIRYAVALVSIVLASLAGHYGGVITHGPGYLAEAAPGWLKGLVGESPKPAIDNLPEHRDSVVIYSHILKPVVAYKCGGCHNSEVAYGKLDITNYTELFEECETAVPIVRGRAGDSELLTRVTLSESDNLYMPPHGPPMTFVEIRVLEYWIENGADRSMRFDPDKMDRELIRLINRDLGLDYASIAASAGANVDSLDESTMERLADSGYRVDYLAEDNFFLDVTFQRDTLHQAQLDALGSVSDQIFNLDLSGCVHDDLDYSIMDGLVNATRIELHGTSFGDRGLEALSQLQKLRVLNLHHTQITDDGLILVNNLPELERLYVWNTDVTPSSVAVLERQHPGLSVDTGFVFVSPPAQDSTETEGDSR